MPFKVIILVNQKDLYWINMDTHIDINELINFTKSIKLLYIEDNEEAQESMIGLLSNFFTNITVSNDGLEGLNAFEKNRYDLIITDIHMPNMNGTQMISHIRKNDPDIYIIVLSAYNNIIPDEIEIDSIKIDDFLIKPIQMNNLMTTLIKLYNKKRDLNVSICKN